MTTTLDREHATRVRQPAQSGLTRARVYVNPLCADTGTATLTTSGLPATSETASLLRVAQTLQSRAVLDASARIHRFQLE